ncbi:MAG: hypothetical protein KatS3mg055_3672 [Chloroflexus sp.]|uniref:hypothetical protein n=1 Tax=Chloroflexus sp. TaxID=1904827 RepID=UPI0021DE881B|nr:hypothetical protein [Chloroflexus sp.]GIV91154.1 MAG: hypothetical protein KatS3mg055_3672 [Chloroflexus sp.]
MEGRRSRSGWIGWLVFLLFILGPSILPPLARWLSQQTGLVIGTTDLFIALIVLMVVISIGSSIFGALRRSSEDTNTTRLPENQPFDMPSAQGEVVRQPTTKPEDVFHTPPPPPEPPRMPASSANLPGAPRFEPIIDPRILTIGMIGIIVILFIFGVLFLFLNP